MEANLNEVELVLSFTSSANRTADSIYKILSSNHILYNYRFWLNQQAGLYIKDIASALYVDKPAIILNTHDWPHSEATMLEHSLLKKNKCCKLFVNFADNTVNPKRDFLLPNCHVVDAESCEESVKGLKGLVANLFGCSLGDTGGNHGNS